jgi:hypothetical protein
MKWSRRFGAGLGAGIAISYVDNVTFKGEVSPIVIVVMLLAAAATATGIWGRRGWITAAVAWMCVPFIHLVKHVLGLADTLHPNTYTSIFMLAAFTFVITMLAQALVCWFTPGLRGPQVATRAPPSKPL